MRKPWDNTSTWRDKVYEYYKQPQPTHSGLTDDELRGLGKDFLMDDKLWRVSGELLDQRAEVERLQARVQGLETALHHISLGSQNSATTKEDLGREARDALAAVSAETEDNVQGYDPVSKEQRRSNVAAAVSGLPIPPKGDD